MSPEHFFMVSLQYHCILGLVEIKKTFESQRQNYEEKMQDAQVKKSLEFYQGLFIDPT